MKQSILAILISFLSIIPAHSQVPAPNQAPAKLDRSRPVPPSPPRPFHLPPIQESSLVKGMKLALIEVARKGIPLVSIRIHFPSAGAAYAPEGKAGLMGFIAELMIEGMETIDGKGAKNPRGTVGINITEEETIITVDAINVIKEEVEEAVRRVAEIVRHPSFPAPGLERIKQVTLASLQAQKGDPGAMAGKRLTQRFYEATGHPYFRQADEKSIQSITRDDVVRFHSEHIVPGKVTVAASGPLSRGELEGLVQKYFGDWPAQVSAGPVSAIPTLSEIPSAQAATGRARGRQGMTIDVIDMPDSEQSAIRMGHLSITANDPDFLVVQVMNEILGGGGILSRLNQNLREGENKKGEDKNWTYGAGSSVNTALHGGTFIVSVDVQTDATAKALTEILKEIDRLRSELVPAEELATMKQSMWGDFIRAQETVEGVATEVGAIEVYGRPKDFLATYGERLNAVTAEKILQAAKRHLRPDELQIAIAGDAAKIVPDLKALQIAPVHVFDVDDNPKDFPAQVPNS